MFKVLVLISCLALSYASNCPAIISRKEWNAINPISTKELSVKPVPYVIITHTATKPCLSFDSCKEDVQGFQTYHINVKRWDDIAYNFVIGGEGTVFEGRGWDLEGAYAKAWNRRSIGIGLVGTFIDTPPSYAQLKSLKDLVTCGIETGYIGLDYSYRAYGQLNSTFLSLPLY